MTNSRDTGHRAQTSVAIAAAAWSVAMQWGLRIVQFVAFLGLARLLEPADFGTFALAIAVMTLLEITAGMGLTDAIVQRRDLDDDEVRSAHWLVRAVALVLAAVVAAVALSIAAVTGAALAVTIASLAPMLVVRAHRTVPEALLRRELDFGPVARAYLSGTIAGAAAGLTAAWFDAGTWALVTQALTTVTVTTVAVRIASGWSPAAPSRRLAAGPLVSLGWKVGASGLLSAVNNRSDDLLLGVHHPAGRVGQYSAGYTLSELAEAGVSGAMGQVALPAFAGVEHDRGRLLDRYLRAVELSAIVAFPLFATLALFAEPAVAVLLGSQWDDAVPVVALVATMSMVRSIGHFNAPLLIATGRADTVLSIMSGQAVLSVVLFSVVAPFGIVAMAVAVLARVVVSLPVTLVALTRHVGLQLRDWGGRVAVPFAAAAVAAVTARLVVDAGPVPSAAIAQLSIGSLTSGVTFMTVLTIVRPGILRGAIDTLLQRSPDGRAS